MAITTSRIVLSSLLAHPDWYASASSKLAELGDACFSGDKFDSALWSTISELAQADKPFTPVDAFKATAKAEFADDIRAVRAMLDIAATETPDTFARRVEALRKETFHRLSLGGMQRLTQQATETGLEFDWLGTLDTARESLGRKARVASHYRPLSSARILDTLNPSRRKHVLPTGFASIDDKCGGYIVGKTTLILARTNAGKSSTLYALARNQLFPHAADNIERQQEQLRSSEAYTRRLASGWPEQDKKPAPHVLLLSVEDDVDDYIGRGVCDLVDVYGHDYLKDPEHAIYSRERGEQFKVFADRFGSGRLTIADYEDADGQEEKTIAQIEATIKGWVRTTRAEAKERGEVEPPLLVLLDYFQKIESPEDEEKNMQERRLLAKVSNRLYKLAKKKKFALCMAVMLLRGDDAIEPDKDSARGGSDVTQDADMIWTLWPFGGSERRAIEAARNKDFSNDDSADPFPVDGALGESADEADEAEEMWDVDASATADAANKVLDSVTVRRAVGELLITCDKNRHGNAGWRVPFYFHRDFKRITEAYDRATIYREDLLIGKVLKAARKHKAKKT